MLIVMISLGRNPHTHSASKLQFMCASRKNALNVQLCIIVIVFVVVEVEWPSVCACRCIGGFAYIG